MSDLDKKAWPRTPWMSMDNNKPFSSPTFRASCGRHKPSTAHQDASTLLQYALHAALDDAKLNNGRCMANIWWEDIPLDDTEIDGDNVPVLICPLHKDDADGSGLIPGCLHVPVQTPQKSRMFLDYKMQSYARGGQGAPLPENASSAARYKHNAANLHDDKTLEPGRAREVSKERCRQQKSREGKRLQGGTEESIRARMDLLRSDLDGRVNTDGRFIFKMNEVGDYSIIMCLEEALKTLKEV
ncbi:hypothetical protein CYMTET_19809 [Cymbomonas tetramitiformis]|uniref:Uncharacterized protein n=1 Tax=Cymbomonas tetramitiformis TaxID=36881 RepID=A0AAE0L4X3_9CHLO|nr:hypothetical protein CYMTET_19809 [Cymbomonas tetramitiformis]